MCCVCCMCCTVAWCMCGVSRGARTRSLFQWEKFHHYLEDVGHKSWVKYISHGSPMLYYFYCHFCCCCFFSALPFIQRRFFCQGLVFRIRQKQQRRKCCKTAIGVDISVAHFGYFKSRRCAWKKGHVYVIITLTFCMAGKPMCLCDTKIKPIRVVSSNAYK